MAQQIREIAVIIIPFTKSLVILDVRPLIFTGVGILNNSLYPKSPCPFLCDRGETREIFDVLSLYGYYLTDKHFLQYFVKNQASRMNNPSIAHTTGYSASFKVLIRLVPNPDARHVQSGG